MPTRFGKDDKGCFAQWGNQKKYYYECGNDDAKAAAKAKADSQGQAIEANEERPMNEGTCFREIQPQLALNKGVALRTEVLNGVTYTVAPVVMITEGVHNGMLYRAEDLQKFPEAWNGRTIPLLHPENSTGSPVTANSPEKIEEQAIGLLFNTRYENGKLKAEAWIDANKANALDTSVMQNILSNQMIEVSTGMFLEAVQEEGEWNGEHYDKIATNIRPDHLAVLPDREGACSIADGAGLPRVNESNGNVLDKFKSFLHTLTQETASKPEEQALVCNECGIVVPFRGSVACPGCGTAMEARLVSNETELREKIEKIRQAIKDANPQEDYVFVEAVYEDHVIFEKEGSGEMFKQGYEINDDEEVVLTGIAEQVEKKVTYEVMQANSKKGDSQMADKDTKSKADQLIESEKSIYTEDARAFLEALEDDKLDAELERLESDSKEPDKDNDEVTDDKQDNDEVTDDKQDSKEEPAQNQANDKNLEEVVAAAVQNALQKQEAKPLVERLAANEECPLSKESLEALKPDELKKLAARFSINAHVRPSVVGNEGSGEEVPDMPVMKFGNAS